MDDPYFENKIVSEVLVRVSKDISETSDLGDALKAPSVSESLLDLHNRLLTVRSRQQRVSELVGTLIRLQGNVRKLVLDRKLELETAEAKVSKKESWKPIVEDFRSAKERNAELSAKTLDERVALTAAEKLQVDVDVALAYAQGVYRELGNQAFDVSTRIKVLGMEGTLG